jgi:hypothetical protein
VSNDLIVGLLGSGGLLGLAQVAVKYISRQRVAAYKTADEYRRGNLAEIEALRREQLELRQALRGRAADMEKQEEDCRKELAECYSGKTRLILENGALRVKVAQLLSLLREKELTGGE